MQFPTTMTFFARFEADILSGKKVITIRDESEKDYQPGSVVDVSTLEEGRCAEQENMTLPQLKQVINDIYPGIESLYVIHYEL